MLSCIMPQVILRQLGGCVSGCSDAQKTALSFIVCTCCTRRIFVVKVKEVVKAHL